MELLRERDAELSAAGYHSQVHVEKDTSPFFLLDRGRRLSLKLSDGRFVSRNGSYSAGDLQARAADISPDALLRPVMQDYLLPTVAYVGGPAEVAYMAQAQVIYRELLGRMPVIMPRNGFTLLNSRATRLLGRYGLQVQDLLDHHDRVQSRIAKRLVPPQIEESFKAVRETVAGRLAELRSELSRLDPTLVAAAHKSEAKMLYQLDKLARKRGARRNGTHGAPTGRRKFPDEHGLSARPFARAFLHDSSVPRAVRIRLDSSSHGPGATRLSGSHDPDGVIRSGWYTRTDMRLLRRFRRLAGVAELADARDSKSRDLHWSCGFDPHLQHQASK